MQTDKNINKITIDSSKLGNNINVIDNAIKEVESSNKQLVQNMNNVSQIVNTMTESIKDSYTINKRMVSKYDESSYNIDDIENVIQGLMCVKKMIDDKKKAFLAMMIDSGLTMAIANPSQELLVSCALATDLLLAKDEADIRYIEYANEVKENREKREAELKKKLAATPVPSPNAGGTESPGEGNSTEKGKH